MVVGLRVLREKESEATALWPLVDTFIATAGPGAMKVLLLDRGFINGPQIGRLPPDLVRRGFYVGTSRDETVEELLEPDH